MRQLIDLVALSRLARRQGLSRGLRPVLRLNLSGHQLNPDVDAALFDVEVGEDYEVVNPPEGRE